MSTSETPAAADIRAKEKADSRTSLTRKQCQDEGNWGPTTQIKKENRGVLHRYLDGSVVRIPAASFYAHLIDLASAPAKKVRQPAKRYQKRPRPRTPQELEGLWPAMSSAPKKLEGAGRPSRRSRLSPEFVASIPGPQENGRNRRRVKGAKPAEKVR
jgi:hypothetical protein